MFGDKKKQPDAQDPDFEILQELEQSTPEALVKQRAHRRVSMRMKVIVEPGNRSDRARLRLQGMTGDVSDGGCQLLLSDPLLVGDLYSVHFDRSVIDAPPALAECLRTRKVRHDAFEAGLRFLRLLDLNGGQSEEPLQKAS